MKLITYDPFTGNKVGAQTELDFGTVTQASHPVKPLLFKLQPDTGESPTTVNIVLTGAGWTGNKFGVYNSTTFSVIQSGADLFQTLTTTPVTIPIADYVWLDVDIPTGQTGATYASVSLSWV
jgi:hypothetical protein